MDLDSCKCCGIFLMWVVRHLPGKGSNTWAASSGDSDGELTIIFLENTLQSSHTASDCCDHFLIGQGVMNFRWLN